MEENRQRIDVPSLNCISGLRFCNQLGVLPSDGKYDFYFPPRAEYNPFPMLIISSSIRRLKQRHTGEKGSLRLNTTYANSYAKHMGFYKACGWNLGNDIGEATGSSKYLPINKISMTELEERSKLNRTVIQEEIEKQAREMATVLSQKDIMLGDALTFLLREIIRNTPEHGKTDEVWYCAQYWPSYDLVELAIMDEGCGLYESLKSNKSLADYINNDADALEYAVKPGISRAVNLMKKRNVDDEWANSGYGLYMASQICIGLGGSFTIASGNKALHLQANEKSDAYTRTFYDTDFKGTAIAVRIKTNKILEFEKIRREAVQKGERLAKGNINAIKTASKSSRGLINRMTQ